MKTENAGRIAAASVSAIALVGLVVQFVVSYQLHDSALHTLWTVLAYFTITTNIIVFVVFLGIAVSGVDRYSAQLIAGTMLSIVLVGAIYNLLLHGLSELSGGSQVANVLLHMVTPILVPIFWIVFAPKGRLRWGHPLFWAIYPLAYLAYALVRGGMTGRYAYPFMDVIQLGWKQTALNAAWIAIAFLLSGFAVVWIDRRLGSRPG